MSATNETTGQPGPFGFARMTGSSIAGRDARRVGWGARDDEALSMLHQLANQISA